MRASPLPYKTFFAKSLALIAAVVMLTGTPRVAAAEDWPTRPITLMVSFTPGGMTDLISRTMARDVSTTLGQPIVVEFKPGGGGVVGLMALTKATPDGTPADRSR